MARKKVVIIGAGIGGLATANLLAKAGFDVHVYEKDMQAGGRAGQKKIKGFTFDTGPSWYLMPDVFEHFYNLLDEPLEKHLSLKKLTPAYKVFFEHNDPLTITGDIEKDAGTFEYIEKGAGSALKKYVTKSNQIYSLSLKHFLYSNFEQPTDFIRRDIVRKIVELPQLLLQPIDSYVSRFVQDIRLKQILEYPMVFLGTSPFDAPAMYSLMSALDFNEGVFYPQGGIYTIIESLVRIGKNLGVSYHFNTAVEGIQTQSGEVASVRLRSGEVIAADIVISNADLHFTETKLLSKQDQTYSSKYWGNKQPGPSALLVYLGVKGRVPELEHHNLLFVSDWKENFEAIYKKKTIPKKASIYISKTSMTDPTVAPKGDENIFILVPLPADISISEKKLGKIVDSYISEIEIATGADIADRIVVKDTFTPQEFKEKYYSWQSSMLGQSHILRQSAFFRTPNKSKKVKNLYYVGGSTTPGIGLPMCLIGAELIYKRIVGDRKGGRVNKIKSIGQSA